MSDAGIAFAAFCAGPFVTLMVLRTVLLVPGLAVRRDESGQPRTRAGVALLLTGEPPRARAGAFIGLIAATSCALAAVPLAFGPEVLLPIGLALGALVLVLKVALPILIFRAHRRGDLGARQARP